MSAERDVTTRLSGPWLGFARVAWIVVVGLLVGLYVLSIPTQFAHRQILCSGEACPFDQISVDDLAQIQRAGLSLGFYAAFTTTGNTLFVLVFLSVAAIIFWRRSDDGLAIFVSLVLASFGMSFNGPLETLGPYYPALRLPAQFFDVLAGASMGIFPLLFPDGRFVPRWTRWLVPLFIAHEWLRIFAPQLLGGDYLFFLILLTIIGVQVYRYRRISNAIQRQQTKWFVFGTVVGIGGFATLLALAIFFSPTQRPSGTASLIAGQALFVCLALVPLSIAMAILRSHLWDIDIIIRRTLIYGVLTAMLALVYLTSVIVLQGLVRVVTGQQQSELVTVVSTLAIAALFVPLRRRVQKIIDRRLYRRKYDAQKVLAEFAARARDETDLNRLRERLLDVVDDTMQPAHMSLWLKPVHAQPRRLSEGERG